jgi:threonine dehydrogenase-like Zn-dependent dehydrogenase
MKAMIYTGRSHVGAENVPDAGILDPEDIVVQVRLSSVCGSDLHILHGFVPGIRQGDIIGHEFIGDVVAVGPAVEKHKIGDRVIVISIIGCGRCIHCERSEFSLCDNSNTHREPAETMLGYTTAAIFGYTHTFGGYAGSHAEFTRVPYADVNAFTVPEWVSDQAGLFVSDSVPTGYMAADNCGLKGGEVVAVIGCGAVGQMSIQCAYLLGASRVIGIDRIDHRLEMAATRGKAEVLDATQDDWSAELRDMTGGRGPDAVGMEPDGGPIEEAYDKVKQALRLQSDRPTVLRHAIEACRKGGTVSVIGVYGGVVDKFPIGMVMNKALTMRSGQQHGQRYVQRIWEHMERGELDPSYLLTHTMTLDDGQTAYDMFTKREDRMMRAAFAPMGVAGTA